MADELQALLNRINSEGIKKTEAEQTQIIKKAETDAQAIIKEAQEKAKHIVAEAEQNAQLQMAKGRESLQQASRDILLSLREVLQDRVQKVARKCVASAMNADVMSDIIRELGKAFAKSGESLEEIELLLSPESLKKLEDVLCKKLADDFKVKPKFIPASHMDGGFKLSFNKADVVFDFSDEALAEAMATFLNPKLAEILLAK